MKKFVWGCCTALALAALAQGKANAWCCFNVGVGARISFACGGDKCCCWGLYQSSDAPFAGHPAPGFSAGGFGYDLPGGFPAHSPASFDGFAWGGGVTAPEMAPSSPTWEGPPPASMPPAGGQTSWSGRFTSWPVGTNYQMPGFGSDTHPAFWYGN